MNSKQFISWILQVVTNDEIGMSIRRIVIFVTLASKLKIWNYPISRQVTEEALDWIWSYLLMITESDAGLPINALIAEEVTEKCRQYLSAGEQVLQQFLRMILRALSGIKDLERCVSVFEYSNTVILSTSQ